MNARLTMIAAGLFAAALLLLPGVPRAECGPGPIVFSNSKGIVQQLLAFSTNMTFLPTYVAGITTGTSGCSNSGVVRADKAAEVFVAWNADNVERDVARGHGPYLASLASLLGCPVGLQPRFARLAQGAFERLPGDAQGAPAHWLAQVRAEMAGSRILATGCTPAS